MRLFVAVELSDEVRRAAGRSSNALREKLGSRVNARWVAPENLHVTVRFIGHVADDRADSLIRVVTAPIAASPFDLRLAGCGVFPSSGTPRVIWIGLDEGLSSLTAIHHEMNARLAPLGFEPENRPFSGHLTLARIKDTKRGANAEVRRAISEYQSARGRCRVTYATLFRSHLSPSGSRYEPLARIDLAS